MASYVDKNSVESSSVTFPYCQWMYIKRAQDAYDRIKEGINYGAKRVYVIVLHAKYSDEGENEVDMQADKLDNTCDEPNCLNLIPPKPRDCDECQKANHDIRCNVSDSG